jgi:uncharacterized membrane protein
VNLPDNLLGEGWYWAAWVVWLPLFAHCVWRAGWLRLRDGEQMNVWLGMIVLLVLVWSLKAGVRPGLSLHLLGATMFTLCFGPVLAFVGLSLVALGVTLNGDGDITSFAANALLTAGSGVAISYSLHRTSLRFLPRHLFVYVFVDGFFAAALTVCGVGLVASVLLAAAGAYDWDYLASDYLPYFLLLGFSEAWLSGMLMTLFVIYRPHWVGSFDDSIYLGNR